MFWLDSFSELFKHPLQFFPTSKLDSDANANALVRLILYVGVAIAVARRRVAPLVLAAVIALFVSFLHVRRMKLAPPTTLAPIKRKPTVPNPFMNRPVMAKEDDKDIFPCTTSACMNAADRAGRFYTTRDTEDILMQPYENREFITLGKHGGAGPNFSELGKELARGSNVY